jgi:serine/threonine protein kinase
MPDHEDSPGGETLDGDAKSDRAEQSLGDGSTLDGGDAIDVEGELLAAGVPSIDLQARFEIKGELGQGGMGAVLLARDKSLDRLVAIKRILGTMIRNAKTGRAQQSLGDGSTLGGDDTSRLNSAAIKRFITEAKSIAALNHNNIVQIYEFVQDNDGPLIVFEYVSGGSLLDRLKKGKLDPEEAIEITCQLCDALTLAHAEGIIHRDIKPANILMTENGVPKLTDFGLAKQQNTDHGQTAVGAIMGTLDFMSPEQRRDSSSVDERSDLWSLAAVAYQMLTGLSPKVIRLDKLPTNIASVLGRMLEDDPADRFSTANEFKQELQPTGPDLTPPIAEGRCPSCGTANDLVRKYCRVCRESLLANCISCDVDNPVWEDICGECGTSQIEAKDGLCAKFIQLLEDSNLLLSDFEFDKAEEALAGILECDYEFSAELVQNAKSLAKKIRREAKAWTANLKTKLDNALSHIGNYSFDAAEEILNQIPQNLSTPQVEDALGKIQIGRDQFEALLEGLSAAQEADNLVLLETQLTLVEELFVQIKAARDAADDVMGVSDELEIRLQQLYDICGSTMEKASDSIQQKIVECRSLISDGLPEEAEQCLAGVQCEWSLQMASEILDELSFIEKADPIKGHAFGKSHKGSTPDHLSELIELYSTCQLCLDHWPNWQMVLEKIDLLIEDLSFYPTETANLLSKYPGGSYVPLRLLLVLDSNALPKDFADGVATLRLLLAGESSSFALESSIPSKYSDASDSDLRKHCTSLSDNGEFELAIACLEIAIFKSSDCRPYANLKLRGKLYKKIGDSKKQRAFQLSVAGSKASFSGAWWQARFLLIQSLSLDPNPHTLNSLAYLLAVTPSLQLVESQLAVKLAELADEMSDGQNALIADTLACAYAGVGNFSAALVCIDKSLELCDDAEVNSKFRINREYILRSERIIAEPNIEKCVEMVPSTFFDHATNGDSSWYKDQQWHKPRGIVREHIELTGSVVLLLVGVIALLLALGFW